MRTVGLLLLAWSGSPSILLATPRAETASEGEIVADSSADTRECMPIAFLEDLDTDAALAAAYLTRAVSASGRFTYRINLNEYEAPSRSYNVLRHAGAIYALARYLEHHPDSSTRAAMLRAASYLKACCLKPVSEHPHALAVWSTSAITGSARAPVAKLGGAGLGLVALGAVERLEPGFTSIDELRGMARFVTYMQKEDGSFYSKYSPATGGRRDRWTSLYYPGEAALGLLMLYDLDPSGEWLHGATRALHYLAHSRRHESEVPSDHWALIATEKLLRAAAGTDELVDESALIRHAAQISTTIMGQQIKSDRIPQYVGGFSPDGRTTPTATRLEGLLAVVGMLPPTNEQQHTELRESTQLAVQFLRRALIRSGQYSGGMPRAVLPLPPDDTQSRRRFNRRASEVRIDYVQHALSGLLEYARLGRLARAVNRCDQTVVAR